VPVRFSQNFNVPNRRALVLITALTSFVLYHVNVVSCAESLERRRRLVEVA